MCGTEAVADGVEQLDSDQLDDLTDEHTGGAVLCRYENGTGGGGCCAGPDSLVRTVPLDAGTTRTVLRLLSQTRPAQFNATCTMIDSPVPLHYVLLFQTDDATRAGYVDVADEPCLGYQVDHLTYDSGQLPPVLRRLSTGGDLAPSDEPSACRDTRVAVRQAGVVSELFPAAEGPTVLRLVDKPRAPLVIEGGCSSLVHVTIREGAGSTTGPTLPTHGQLRMPPGVYTITVDLPACATDAAVPCTDEVTATHRTVRIVAHRPAPVSRP
ncbi:hypothetical protein [Nocardioides marinquilinus]|uniref:hypothetical protein n=1 Tax=Nocardioides marinquilinus TaxID=1210400 RepID=UPI0031ED2432